MINPNYNIRDYQEEARAAVKDGFASGIRRGILTLPTGAGKNFVACSVMDTYPKKNILFLADRNELIAQPANSILGFLNIAPGIEKAEERCADSDRIVVGSIQTLSRRYQNFRPDRWDLIIADECHLSMSESWQAVLNYFGQHAQVLGMTATPFRHDGQNLMSWYEKEFFRKTIDNLQDEGWLVPLEICNLGGGIDVNALTVKRGVEGKKFDEQEVADTIEPHLEAIARELLGKHSDRKTLAFLPLVEISKKFARIAYDCGLLAMHVDGKDPDRDAKVQAFRDGKYQLLCNSQLLHTGFDAPCCSATLNLTPMFSSVRYQQIIGRSLRPLPELVDNPSYDSLDRNGAIALSEKSDAMIFDPMWMFGAFGLMIPEALSAQSLEEANAIRKRRQATGQTNLQQAQQDYVKEKEEEMLARLEAERAAAQRGKEDGTSVQEFAIRTGDHFLASYEPVYSKEREPLKPFDKLMLKQRGIDPESVRSRGECDLVCRSVNIRRYNRLAEINVVLKLISAHLVSIERAWKLSAHEAQTILRRNAIRA